MQFCMFVIDTYMNQFLRHTNKHMKVKQREMLTQTYQTIIQNTQSRVIPSTY